MHRPTHDQSRDRTRRNRGVALIAVGGAALASALVVTGLAAADAPDPAAPAAIRTSGSDAPAEGRAIPAPVVDTPPGDASVEIAVLAGGCFWGVQGVFQHVEGVLSAVSGYAGGEQDTAVYEQVGTGTTGHAESVAIMFDPRQISYGRILQIYFSVAHDPTELDRQGPDVGPQYRSTIFPTDAEQARIAEAYIDQLDEAAVFDEPIVTTIEPDREFYPAEAYHQDFMTENPTYPYIVANDLPKVEALEHYFPDLFRNDPVLVHEGAADGS